MMALMMAQSRCTLCHGIWLTAVPHVTVPLPAALKADDTEAACVMSPSLIAAIQRDINTSQQGY